MQGPATGHRRRRREHNEAPLVPQEPSRHFRVRRATAPFSRVSVPARRGRRCPRPLPARPRGPREGPRPPARSPSPAPVLARRHGHAVWPQRPPASPLLRARRRAPRVVAHAERPARAFGGGAQPDLLCRAGAAAEAAGPQRLERAYPDVAGGGEFAWVSVFGARPAGQHPAVSSSAARARSTSARLAKGTASAATGVRWELSGI
jgi:hypothetical protein